MKLLVIDNAGRVRKSSPDTLVRNNANADAEDVDASQKRQKRIPLLLLPIRILIGFIIVSIITLGAIVFARAFVFGLYEVPTPSMVPTILPGDKLFAWTPLVSGEAKASDIITFNDPVIPGRTLVKRLIATEGQEVDIRNDAVYIDGELLSETYTEGITEKLPSEMTYPHVVSEGSVWVMGDNRQNSADSRVFGDVPLSEVTGCVAWIFSPAHREYVPLPVTSSPLIEDVTEGTFHHAY